MGNRGLISIFKNDFYFDNGAKVNEKNLKSKQTHRCHLSVYTLKTVLHLYAALLITRSHALNWLYLVYFFSMEVCMCWASNELWLCEWGGEGERVCFVWVFLGSFLDLWLRAISFFILLESFIMKTRCFCAVFVLESSCWITHWSKNKNLSITEHFTVKHVHLPASCFLHVKEDFSGLSSCSDVKSFVWMNLLLFYIWKSLSGLFEYLHRKWLSDYLCERECVCVCLFFLH